VHSSKETEKLWLAEWGYRGLFSSLSSSRAGVSVFFNNNFSFEIRKYFSDPREDSSQLISKQKTKL